MARSTTGIVAKYSSKAAGVYREVIDETATNLATSSTNVVVVIQSETGPVMKPIYCQDADTLHSIFGTRNAKLEAKGNFGILMAEHVLEAGPIWVLNIKNIAPNQETLQIVKLACNNADTEMLSSETINTVYDTTKFWNIDPMYGKYGDGPVLSFASVANGTVTVVVSKFIDTDKQYQYTVAETKQYNDEFLGEGLDDKAFVSDYMVQVDIFKTDLSHASLGVIGAVNNGKIAIDKLEAIRKDRNAKYFDTYVGAVGNVIDLSGNSLNIANIINADYLQTGVWCAINTDAINANGIDLIGQDAIVMSGDASALPTTQQITRIGESFTPVLSNLVLQVASSAKNTAYILGDTVVPVVADVIATKSDKLRVLNVAYVGDNITIDTSKLGTWDMPIQPNGQPYEKRDGIFVYPASAPSEKAGQQLEWNEQTNKYIYYYQQYVTTNGAGSFGSLPATPTPDAIVKVRLQSSAGSVEAVHVATSDDTWATVGADIASQFAISGCTWRAVYDDNVLTFSTTAVNNGIEFANLLYMQVTYHDNVTYNEPAAGVVQASSILTLMNADITVTTASDIPTVSTPATESTPVDMTAAKEAFGTAVKVRLVTFDGVITTTGEAESVVVGPDTVSCIATEAVRLEPWYKRFNYLNMHVAAGIKSLDKHYVNGTVARQNAILDMLNSIGLTNAFSDPTIFKCRYMVDSFKTFIAPNQKYQYGALAAKCDRFLTFIPAPFYYELRSSKNPSFYDLLGNFQMSYVKNGSNPDIPSTNSFSYCTDPDGSKYLMPIMNVLFNDGFADKVVPSTGMVAKYFYMKHLGAHKVYDIVAGQDWAMSADGVVGPEFDAAESERAAMELMGTNVLQTIDGRLQIRSNRTAYQTVSSAFNYPETLEKVFYVSDFVEPTLDGKLFKYNNADSRLACKLAADEACDQMVADGVISAYANTCDLSNNPVEVRQAGIILLDTELYNEYGIRIAIHRTTVKNADK